MSAAEALLPAVTGPEDYRPCFDQTEPWLPVMRLICRRHGLDPDRLERIAEGSAIVFRAGEVLIKLLPPFWAQEAALDKLGLERARGRLPVHTPELLATGEVDAWAYLLTRRLPGRALKLLWRGLEPQCQRRLAREIGELTAALQRLDPAGLPGSQPGGWADFRSQQARGFAAFQRDQGLAEPLITPFTVALEQAVAAVPPATEAVFLHSDLTDEHLLLEDRDGWRLTGLLDFGDAMAGWDVYELAAPCVMLTAHRPELRRELLTGFGREVGEDELLVAQLLHRFCHLPGLMRNGGLTSAADEGPAAFRACFCSLA
ncbi:MAG TPA: aminoglycoside 3'-phosphotransferase/choline kinase family protein [Candidatus Obscuribacterales bacterium]